MWVEWTKAWSNTSMHPQWIYVYMDLCAFLESNKCKANRTPHYLFVFRWKWGPVWLSNNSDAEKSFCQIVFRIPRKWMESKFLDQDVDVVFLANKGIVIGSLVGRNCKKSSWRQESSWTTSGSRKMDSDLVLTECWSSLILRLSTSPIDLIHSERVSSSTSSSLAHCLAYTSHASMFWCHENETGSLNFEPLP